MPIQIKRLLPLFVIFIAGFLIVRSLLVPDTFGEHDFYRGASLDDNAAPMIRYAGSKACIECHDDISAMKEADVHESVACEACHGPGAAHSEDNETGKILIPEGRDYCGKCHSINAARRTEVIFQIDLNEHNVEHECTYCHNPHSPWDLRNQEAAEDSLL